MSLIARAINETRLAKSRLKHKTVRFKVKDLRLFYKKLNAENIQYVVLRWFEEMPFSSLEEQHYSKDIDHLIAAGNLGSVCRIASTQPGPISVDFYTDTGERGGAYLRMPYYMPCLAETILTRRVQLSTGAWIPCPDDALLSFLYHLIYHKGLKSGIPFGLNFPTESSPGKDYLKEARRLADLAGIALPEPVNLLALHDFLKAHEWSMALDLMPRWQDQHTAIKAIYSLEKKQNDELLEYVQDITIFVVRQDPIGIEGLNLIRRRIEERFMILNDVILSPEAQKRLINRTRGGDWTNKGWTSVNKPTQAFICRSAGNSSALTLNMSAAKIKRRYPQITTTDVLIKRAIRIEVAQIAGLGKNCNVLHSTDNPLEALAALQAIYGEKELGSILCNLKNTKAPEEASSYSA